jgi:hypothetical protein
MLRTFVIGVAWAASIAAGGSSQDAQGLMSRSVAVAEANWVQAPNYSFTRADVKSKSGSEFARMQYEVSMLEGSPYLRLTAEGGQPLSIAQAKEQEAKYRRELSRREHESPGERQKRIEKYREDRARDHALLMALCDAFDYTVTGAQRIAGRDTWVLHGKPKANYVPKNRETKVLAGMEVTFWIDKETYQWPRVEAEVRTPVSLYGMLGKVNPGTKFVLEQEPVALNLWLPKRFGMQVNATALGFFSENSSSEEIYSDYRPAGQESAVSSPSRAGRRSSSVE